MVATVEPTRRVEDLEEQLLALRREVKQATSARDEASDAIDAQSSFLAHVSHELRTPMNSVLGMARLTLATELTDEQREYVTVIEESADALLTLVNDLLDKAKIDAGRLELEAIPFRIDDLVASAVRGVRVMADHKGLGLRYERGDDVPATVVGDPTRLRQVLLNLVANAAKFTHEGTIEVAVTSPAGDEVMIAVHDTGIGIAAEKLDTIFKEFRQADQSTTREYGGSGLGLSISSGLVEMMGGTLEVESEVGAGSTFSFTIELPAAETGPDPTAHDLASHRGATVLWLTDEKNTRSGALEIVRERGLEPFVTGSVEAAIAALAEAADPPAAVVVDLTSGALDIAWELGREAQGAPIVVITPGGQRGDAARCRTIGVAGYLTGPVVPVDMADTIDAVLAGVPDLVTRHWLNERRRSLKVLVADDSITNRTLLARMLDGRGHLSVHAADGHEVLDMLAREEIDVVLLDLHMPNMDGYEAAEKIRALGDWHAEVPIVAVSGSVSDMGREKCLALGIDEFVAKPFRPEHILEMIERLARS